MAEAEVEAAIATWELVSDESDIPPVDTSVTSFQTERMIVPGGWIYRCIGIFGTANTCVAMCFVPGFGHPRPHDGELA